MRSTNRINIIKTVQLLLTNLLQHCFNRPNGKQSKQHENNTCGQNNWSELRHIAKVMMKKLCVRSGYDQKSCQSFSHLQTQDFTRLSRNPPPSMAQNGGFLDSFCGKCQAKLSGELDSFSGGDSPCFFSVNNLFFQPSVIINFYQKRSIWKQRLNVK